MNTVCRFIKTHPDIEMINIRIEKEDVTGSAGVEISMSTTEGNNYNRYICEDKTFTIDRVCDPELLQKLLSEMYDILMKRRNSR